MAFCTVILYVCNATVLFIPLISRPENDSDSDFEEPMSVSSGGVGGGRGRKRGSGRGGSVSTKGS